MYKLKEKNKERKIIKSSIPVKINLTKDFLNQVKYLTTNIPSEEWSGVMFYDTKGEISNLNTFEITPVYIYLMDIGNGVKTDFSYTEELAKFKMDNPQYLGKTFGKIHSHNMMNAFMSGTDIEDLHQNSTMYNMYLSIVTNNNLVFDGGIDINYNIKEKITKISFVNTKGENVEQEESEKDVKVTEFHNLTFLVEKEVIKVSDKFKERFDEVKKKKEKKKMSQNLLNFGAYDNYDFDDTSDSINDEDILNILCNSLINANKDFSTLSEKYKESLIQNTITEKMIKCENNKQLEKIVKEVETKINKGVKNFLSNKILVNRVNSELVLNEKVKYYLLNIVEELSAVLFNNNEASLADKMDEFYNLLN